MRILGVNVGNKESSIALVENGVIRAALCEERLSRLRYDEGPPVRALNRLLEARKWTLDDVDVVVGNVSENTLRQMAGLQPRKSREIPWQKQGPEQFGLHHLCHAAGAFYTSGFSQALVLTVDNHGDDDTLVLFRGDAQGLHRLAGIRRGELTVGGIYEEATLQLGFGRGGEGKLMGLAGYAQADPQWAHGFLHLKSPLQLGSTWRQGHPTDGILRAPWAPIDFDLHAKMAASVQLAMETTVLQILCDAHAETGLTDVCVAGGVALNCSLNGQIGREKWLQRLWIPPSPADPGNALGAALLAAQRLGETPTQRLLDGGLGVPHDRQWTLEWLKKAQENHEVLSLDQAAQQAAEDVAKGALIGWLQGPSEFGPRALGHRSLLGDPRRLDVRDRLNEAKLREGWRPVAPAILAEAQHEWLADTHPSPFMLLAMEALPRMQDLAPAAVHVDRTVRAQTVTTAQGPYHTLIATFAQKTGVPMVLNTSFNQAGEPIVESPEDALDCARRAGLDVLYLDGIRLALPPRGVTDRRKKLRDMAIAGPVDMPWQLLAAQIPGVQVAQHEGAELPVESAIRALGLQHQPRTELPLVATGTPLDRMKLLETTVARPVFALGPLPTGTLNLPEQAHVSLQPMLLAGVQALAAVMPQHPQKLTIQLPLLPTPLDDQAAVQSHAHLLHARLTEALGVAMHLLKKPLQNPQLTERWPAPHVQTRTEDGQTAVEIRLIEAPLEIVVQVEAGLIQLTGDGRLSQPPPPGQTGMRTQDFAMTPFGWGQHIAATLNGQPWAIAQNLVLQAGNQAGHALTAWWQTLLGHPGQLANTEREAVRRQNPQLPEILEMPREVANAVATAVVLHPGAALLAVKDGVRPAASVDNVKGPQLEALLAVVHKLGLHARMSQPYASAAPLRQAVRADMAETQTVFVSREERIVERLLELDAQMGGQQGPQNLAHIRAEMGELFGYPACCIGSWLEIEQMKLHEAFTHAIRASTRGQPLGLLNHRPAGKFTQHFPCSYTCLRSLQLASQVRHAVVRDGERLVQTVHALWPLEQLPQPAVQAIDALALVSLEERSRLLSQLVTAPLIYVDPTRYVCLIGTQLEPVQAEPGAEAWLLHSGQVVSSADFRLHPGAPEEGVLQEKLRRELVLPMARSLALGPVRWQQGLPGMQQPTRVQGLNLTLELPWQLGLLLPYRD